MRVEKASFEQFLSTMPAGFSYLSGFDNGMQSTVRVRNDSTGLVHSLRAENCRHLNPRSRRFSEAQISSECSSRGFAFISRTGPKITIEDSGGLHHVYLSNFMSGMDPARVSVSKRSSARIDNSAKNFISKSERDDISDYEIVEFRGMKRPMRLRHRPSGELVSVRSPRIFSKGGYRDFPWDSEKSRVALESDFLGKLRSLPDSAEYSLPQSFRYVNNKTHVRMSHSKCGREFQVRPDNFLNLETRCPFCSLDGVSAGQRELALFVRGIYGGELIENYWHDRGGFEVDVYLPELKIGIEFDGIYWHSEEKGKDRHYHSRKTETLEADGERMIHVFEDEWSLRRKIVESKIKRILGLDPGLRRIGARSCSVREISTAEKNAFLEANHIQGADTSGVRLGLFSGGELVSAMTFSRPRAGTGKNTGEEGTYELVRFASRIDCNVPGAFGKLLSAFRSSREWSRIVTYADLRWSSESNVYLKQGFARRGRTQPNYWYADRTRRYHRFGFRKQALKSKFPSIYDSSLTEGEIVRLAGYYRVWDCGNLVYELTKDGK